MQAAGKVRIGESLPEWIEVGVAWALAVDGFRRYEETFETEFQAALKLLRCLRNIAPVDGCDGYDPARYTLRELRRPGVVGATVGGGEVLIIRWERKYADGRESDPCINAPGVLQCCARGRVVTRLGEPSA